MRELFRAIGRVAASGLGVLITGETGTGKELVARALHRESRARIAAVRRAQHGGDSGRAARIGTVRPRSRRVHRRGAASRRAFRAGRRRHAVSRRDRRHAAAAADAFAARARGRRVLSRRRARADSRRCARDRGDASGSRGESHARRIPRRSPASARCRAPASAAAARAARGHSADGRAVPRARSRCGGRAGESASRRRRSVRCATTRGRATCASSRICASASRCSRRAARSRSATCRRRSSKRGAASPSSTGRIGLRAWAERALASGETGIHATAHAAFERVLLETALAARARTSAECREGARARAQHDHAQARQLAQETREGSRSMRDALRWIGYLLARADRADRPRLFAAYRLRGPSRAQREALALHAKGLSRRQQGTQRVSAAVVHAIRRAGGRARRQDRRRRSRTSSDAPRR